MDAKLLDQSLSFHGTALMDQLTEEHGESLQVPVALRRRYSSSDSTAAAATKDRCCQAESVDPELTADIHKFIARKADMLFNRARRKGTGRETTDLYQPDVFGIMPPLESFMGLPSDVCQDHFYENLRTGDFVVGVMSSVSDSGVIATLLCTETAGLHRDIDELNISAFCPAKELPRMFSHQSLTEAYHPRDVFRGIVLAVNRDKKRIFLSLRESAATSSQQHLPKIGLISKDDFPVHYRRKLERCGLTYSELLTSILGFTNKGSVDVLQASLGLTNSASLMRGLHGVKVSEDECAEALRKWQTNKQVHNSVVLGVEMMKKGRHLESVQHLNMALKIDPLHTEALVARGAVYANNASYEKAIEDFAKALEGNPKHVNARKYLLETRVACARRYEEQGQVEEAVDHYREVLTLDPQSVEARNGLEKCRRLQSKGQGSTRKSEDSDSSSSEDKGPNLQTSADKLMRLIKAEKKDGRKKQAGGGQSPTRSDKKSKKKKKKKERRKSSKQRADSSPSSSSSSPASPHRSPHAELNKIFEDWQSEQRAHSSSRGDGDNKAPREKGVVSSSPRRLSSNSDGRHRGKNRASRSSSSVSSKRKQSRKRRSKSRLSLSSSRSRSRSRSRRRSSSSASSVGKRPVAAKTSFGSALMDVFLSKSGRGAGGTGEGKERSGGGGGGGGGSSKWDDLSTYIGDPSAQLEKVLLGFRPSKKQQQQHSPPPRSRSSSRSSSSGGSNPRRKGSMDRRGERSSSRSYDHGHRRRGRPREGRFSRRDAHSDGHGSSAGWRGQDGRGERRGGDSMRRSREQPRAIERSGSREEKSRRSSKHRSKHKERTGSLETARGKEDRELGEGTDPLATDNEAKRKDRDADHNRNENAKDATRKPPDAGDAKDAPFPETGREKTKGSTSGPGVEPDPTSDKGQTRTKDGSTLQTSSKERDLRRPCAGKEGQEPDEKEKSRGDNPRTKMGSMEEEETAAIVAKDGLLSVASKWDSPTRRSRWDSAVAEAGRSLQVKPADRDKPDAAEPKPAAMTELEKKGGIKLTWNQRQQPMTRPQVVSRWTRFDHLAAAAVAEHTAETATASTHDASTSKPGTIAWPTDKEESPSRARDDSSAKWPKEGKESLEMASKWIELPPSRWSTTEVAGAQLKEEPAFGREDRPGKWYTPEMTTGKQTKDDVPLTALVPSKWDERTSVESSQKNSDEKREAAAKWSRAEEPTETLAKHLPNSLPLKADPEEVMSRWSQHEAQGKMSKDMYYTKRSAKDKESNSELEGAELWAQEASSDKRSREASTATRSTGEADLGGDREEKRSKSARPSDWSSKEAPGKWMEEGLHSERSGNEALRKRLDEFYKSAAGKPADSGQSSHPTKDPAGKPSSEARSDDQSRRQKGKAGEAAAAGGQEVGPGSGKDPGGGGKMSELKELMFQHLTLQKLELQHLSLQDLEQRLCQEIVGHMSTNTSIASDDSGPSHHRHDPRSSLAAENEDPPRRSRERDPAGVGEAREQPQKMGEPSLENSEMRPDASFERPTRPDKGRREAAEREAYLQQRESTSPGRSSGKPAQDGEDVASTRDRDRSRRRRSRDNSPAQQTDRRPGRDDDEGWDTREDQSPSSHSYCVSTKISKTTGSKYSVGKESKEREGRSEKSDGKDRRRSSPEQQEKYTVQTSSRHKKDATMSSWMEKIISNVDVKPSSKVNPGDVDIRFLFRTSSSTVDSSFSHQLLPDKQSSSSSRKRRKSSSSSSERESIRSQKRHSSYQYPDTKGRSKKKKKHRSSSLSSSSSSDDRRREKVWSSSAQKKKQHRSSSSSSSSSDDRRRHRKSSSSRKRKRETSSSSSLSPDDRQKKKSSSSVQRGRKSEKRSKRCTSSPSSPSSSFTSPSPGRKQRRPLQQERGTAGSHSKPRSEDYHQQRPWLVSKSVTDVNSEGAKFTDPKPAEPSKAKLTELEEFLKELKTKKKEKLMAEGKVKKA